jgi:hypothetical protein
MLNQQGEKTTTRGRIKQDSEVKRERPLRAGGKSTMSAKSQETGIHL